jgi:hypothetical protein
MFGHMFGLPGSVDGLRASQHETQTRIDELERHIGRLAVLTRSLADLCISSRVLTREQLAQHMREIGHRPDGGLDPRTALDGLELDR